MRLLVGLVLAALAAGCARGSWLPAVRVSAETSRGGREALRVGDRRAADAWRHRVGVSLGWFPGAEPEAFEDPPAAPRRAAVALAHADRRPAYRSETLCQWERRARGRALRALAHRGDEP